MINGTCLVRSQSETVDPVGRIVDGDQKDVRLLLIGRHLPRYLTFNRILYTVIEVKPKVDIFIFVTIPLTDFLKIERK